jgi:hypothetical protein
MWGKGVLSSRTFALGAAALAVIVASAIVIRSGSGEGGGFHAIIASLPDIVTSAAAGILCLWAAFRFGREESLHRQWLFIGIGMSALCVGDTIYAIIEATSTEAPYPSIADIFYVASFVSLGVGLLLAVMSFRNAIRPTIPVLISAGVVAATTIGLSVAVYRPILADAETGALEKALSIFYPLGDSWLLLFPALALAIALSRLGSGRLAWPWWAVAVGFALISVSDVLYSQLETAGAYTSGSFVDLGWWLGYSAVALGASIVVDVQRPNRKRSVQS